MKNWDSQFTRALVGLFVCSCATFADIYSIQPLLPTFTEHFGVSPTVSSLSVSLVVVAIALSLFYYGPLSDAVGRKNLLTLVLIGASVPTLAAGFAQNFHFILLTRFIQGLMLGGLQSVAMAYIGEEIDKKRLALAMGLYISGNSIGGMAGRIISGSIAYHFSWQAVFWTFGLFNLVAGMLVLILLPPSKNFQPHPFNLRSGLIDMMAHLKNPALVGCYLVGFCLMFSFVGVYNYASFLLAGPPYFLSTRAIGLIFLTYLAGTVSSTLSGALANRWGNPATIALNTLISMTGMLLTFSNNIYLFILGLTLFCFGFFGGHSAASSWVSMNAKGARCGASSLYLVMFYFGGGLGGVLLGPLWINWKWPGVMLGTMVCLAVAIGLAKYLQGLRRFARS
ncbi:MFS transporter [Desulforamulus ruminis]|uniref:Major facilitator superfamily MFS_1 n=1 Tax=Desulforamulus ruminis (strain ATCC 23193 / DSM 2154 / NCIMB 8452 / DL) TaxID=696281 RepID=F6DQF3_DESRL|nr:MFS transporter [Desulforamulus ruminis]AEG60847.1 major facilitator superfamily MFS_1 [Desulforamulus ruminis DSM 2154]